jgi:hypothetical protein
VSEDRVHILDVCGARPNFMTQSPEANCSRADFARLLQSRFDWSAIAGSYESVYRQAIADACGKESG